MTTRSTQIADAIRFEIEHHAADLANWAKRMEREARNERPMLTQLDEWHARAEIAMKRLDEYMAKAKKEVGQ